MALPDYDRKAILERFIREVWSDGRLDAVDAYLGRSYTIYHDPGDPWEGRTLTLDEYKERARVSRAPFPDQRFELQHLFADGNAVVATWLWAGTHMGDLPGFAATGRRITTSGATVYLLRGRPARRPLADRGPAEHLPAIAFNVVAPSWWW